MADGMPWFIRMMVGATVLLIGFGAGLLVLMFVLAVVQFGMVVPLAVGGFLALALVAGTVFERVTS